MAWRQPPFFFRARGFTLVELVVVISIVVILSVFAAARLTRSGFETRALYDQLLAQVAYARKTAVAQRRPVCVHLSAGASVVRYGETSPAACNVGGAGVASPVGPAPFTLSAPAGNVLAPTGVIRFDGLGRYRTETDGTPPAPLVVSVTGDGTFQFCVDRETGYAYPVAAPGDCT
jgi:MSHA pilin protein MshC